MEYEDSTETNVDTIIELGKIGVLFGHRKSKTHPKMKPFIAGNKNEIEILNPDAVLEKLNTAIEFLKTVYKKGGRILMVGTTYASKEAIETMSKEFNFPFVVTRWLGGTLTNFVMMTTRIQHYNTLKSKREQGELAKYTKKEQLQFDKQISKMSQVFEGIKSLSKIPEVVFVVDPHAHGTVVREAKKTKIPVVAILDSNDNIEVIDYPILGNDRSRASINWVLEKIKTELKKVQPSNEPKA